MWNIFRKLVLGNKIAFNPVHSPWNLHLCTFFFQNKTTFEVFMHLLESRKWKRISKQLVAKLFENFLHCSIIFFTTSSANICWSWRRRQHVFSVTILRLPRRLEDTLSRRLENVLKTSRKTKNCYAEDVFKTCLEDVLRTYLEDVFEANKMFTSDICI